MTDFPTEGAPPFINRRLSIEEWTRYVAAYNFGRLTPSRLVLHHTFRPDERSWNGLTTMRGMQRFYADQGWPAGPHIFVAADGIWLATPMSRIGVHAGIGNGSLAQGWYSIGLEMVGYFDTRLPDGVTWRHALAVMGELSRRLQIPPRRLISFHRDYTSIKSCPGWAVSKEWVWTQVEAYLAGADPPPPPPPPPPGILPSDERLLEALLDQSYRCKAGSQGYNPAWAFHQYAVQQGLGMPMGPSVTATIAGKRINYQPFARDTLFVEVPNWGDVQTLSALLGGSIPPSGLGRELLERTYQAGGSPLRPDWAFHQFAVINRLGPPIGTSEIMNVDGRQWAYQVFAVDTLYSPTSNYADVRLLSRLAQAADQPTLRLREALLAATYRKAGSTYRPDWAFHQLARSFNIGAPLCGSYQLQIEGASFALQIYALDTLFNLVPNWSRVRRLSDLAVLQGRSPSGSASTAAAGALGAAPTTSASTPAAPVVVPGDHAPPLTEGFAVMPFAPPSPAYGSRGGQGVQLVVLHAVAGPLARTLAQMTAPGAQFATHYVVSTAGNIYQLVEESRAARHAGVVDLRGRQVNVDAISIGIALERPAEWPAVPAGSTDMQVQALRWLLSRLGQRYRLRGEALLRWGSLAGSSESVVDGLPLAALREALTRA